MNASITSVLYLTHEFHMPVCMYINIYVKFYWGIKTQGRLISSEIQIIFAVRHKHFVLTQLRKISVDI